MLGGLPEEGILFLRAGYIANALASEAALAGLRLWAQDPANVLDSLQRRLRPRGAGTRPSPWARRAPNR